MAKPIHNSRTPGPGLTKNTISHEHLLCIGIMCSKLYLDELKTVEEVYHPNSPIDQ